MQADTLRLFAVAAPGTEALVASELRALPAIDQIARRGIVEQPGGVEWQGDLAALYRANLHLRIATRLLVRLGELRALRFDELVRGLAKLPWRRFAPTGPAQRGEVPLLVTAAAHRCRLIHTGALAERVAIALDQAGVGVRPISAEMAEAAGPDAAVLRVLVRGESDRFTVSVDSSGALLHRRGYRQDPTPAPLRETLAAALLAQLGWPSSQAGTRAETSIEDEALCDPMCGSGTLLIEGALLKMRRAPGRGRRFAFHHWPGFDEALWRRLLDEAQAQERTLAPGRIFGGDLDPQAVQAAQRNAERAGLSGLVDLTVADVARSRLPAGRGPGLVTCNPPYGLRLGAGRPNEARENARGPQHGRGGPDALASLYRALGRFARSQPGWRLALLTTRPALAALAGKVQRSHRLHNGGLLVHLCAITPPRPDRRPPLPPEDLGEGVAHAADQELHRDRDQQQPHDTLEDGAP
ncbi:MAG: hypothetical protein U1A78_06880 [Polyangia bacterium]